jgi:hypothetical protein
VKARAVGVTWVVVGGVAAIGPGTRTVVELGSDMMTEPEGGVPKAVAELLTPPVSTSAWVTV